MTDYTQEAHKSLIGHLLEMRQITAARSVLQSAMLVIPDRKVILEMTKMIEASRDIVVTNENVSNGKYKKLVIGDKNQKKTEKSVISQVSQRELGKKEPVAGRIVTKPKFESDDFPYQDEDDIPYNQGGDMPDGDEGSNESVEGVESTDNGGFGDIQLLSAIKKSKRK